MCLTSSLSPPTELSTSEEHVLREKRPADSLIPALDGSLELSGDQIKFLRYTIRDLNPAVVEVEAHIRKKILEVRDSQIYPYPCIRAFKFVNLNLPEHAAFFHVLKVIQGASQANNPVFLDVGCCIGTDLRYLVHSGYPSTSVIGCEIRREFVDLGYALYGDRDTCPIVFFVGDIFGITPLAFPQTAAPGGVAPPSLTGVQSLNQLRGRVKYIYAGALFHLFDEGTQEAIARRLATLLDVTEGHGPAIIFGKHVGKTEASAIEDAMGRYVPPRLWPYIEAFDLKGPCPYFRTRYAHSPASWVTLWERVLGDEVRVRVDAVFRPMSKEGTQLRDWKWNPGRATEHIWWSVWVG